MTSLLNQQEVEHINEVSPDARQIGVNGIVITMPWGDEVLTFKYEGKAYVKIADITGSLGVKHERQLEYLRDHEALSNELLSRTPVQLGIEEAVLPQHVDREFWAITLRGMYAWLCGISVKRLASNGKQEIAEKLLAYQHESMDVLENYWTYGIASNPRLLIDNVLHRLHAEGRLDLSVPIEGNEHADMIVNLWNVVSDTRLVHRPVNLKAQFSRSAAEGSSLLLKLLREIPVAQIPQDALLQRSVLKLLSLLEQTPNSEVIFNVWSSRFLVEGIHPIIRTYENVRIDPNYPATEEDYDFIKSSIQRALWRSVHTFTEQFCVDVFQEEITEVPALADMLMMSLHNRKVNNRNVNAV